MAFWLTGLVFLFCCGTMNASESVEFCPLAKAGSHCSKTKSDTNLPRFSENTENANFDCCAFLPRLFDKSRKLEKFQETAQVPANLKIDLPRIFPAENDLYVAETYHQPVFQSEKIFIKNCVFRI